MQIYWRVTRDTKALEIIVSAGIRQQYCLITIEIFSLSQGQVALINFCLYLERVVVMQLTDIKWKALNHEAQ